MKKIKISELPLSESLKGLHTIGTDAQNRSVKVSLEFIQTTTEEAVNNANTAAESANNATEDTIAATEYTEAATVDANKATEEARNATQAILQAFSSLVPSGMTVNAPSRITFGNISPNLRIDAVLAPEGTAKNIIYIGDNKAVEVDTEGRLTVIGLGTSKIHVVPTLNTALARTVLIEVGRPTLRKVKTKSLRLLGNGNFRLN